MGLRLDCDICSRFIRVVNFKELKNMSDTEQSQICKDCQVKIERLDKAIEKLKSKYERNLQLALRDAKNELTTEITKLAQEGSDDTRGAIRY